ncbi:MULTISPECIES: autotransporter outer membrane beta-barrel domain-containing protein [Pseudescherichia]|uniref:autotransporter family protein n=1 Tax=Pseudescherichia TaxID=2055880 RepID=UPI001EDFBB98|nr:MULTISPECIES: autotransporter outer membrane beta-barrel domain-containing protein [Pseudescherichia]
MKKKRLSQLISLLVASTAAQGVLTTHAFATSDVIIDTSSNNLQIDRSANFVHITDTGMLTGAPTTALTVNQNAMVTTLTNDGVINDVVDDFYSPNSNIVQIDGTVDAFNNNGTIASVNPYHNGSIVAVGASGTVGSFTNSGTIKSSPDNYNYGYDNTGAVNNTGHITTLINTVDGTITGYRGVNNQGTIDTLTNAGVISAATNNNGMFYGQNGAIYNRGTIGTLHNTGTIQTDGTENYYNGAGIFNYGTINTLINDNKISGNTFGILNSGTLNAIENNGEIAAKEYGVYFESFSDNQNNGISKIVNNGDIASGNIGLYLSSYNNQLSQVNIINNGTLSGDRFAFAMDSWDNESSADVTLNNAGLIKGDIFFSGTKPLTINGGTTAQGILTGLNGVGNISNYGSGIVFGTGSLLLNDHINTADTVLNREAVLQINNNITISGNYHQNAAATLISGIADLETLGNDITTDTGYGRLNVTGNATIDENSSVKLLRTGSTYNFAEGQRYVVINANGAETNYNADKLNYQAIGYNGAVTGSVYEDGASKALVLTVGAKPVVIPPVVTEPEEPVVTPPVDVPPVVTEPEEPVVTPPVVTPPVVTPPVVTPPVVTPPVVTEPVVTEPVVTPPVVTEPVVTPPVVTEPVITEPVVTPPVVTEPVVTPPVVTEPVVTEPVVTPPVVTEPVVTEPVVTPPVVTEPVVTPPTVTEPAPAEPIKQGLATIPSATAALGGLGNYSGISPQLLELYNASLAIEGTQEANRVGERLSPGQNINTSSAATVATSTAQAVVGAHIDAVRNPSASGNSGVATGDDYASNWIVWGQPFGGYARQESTDDVSGYSAKFGGLILGADRALGDDWRLGAAVNYSNTSVHGKDNLSGNTSTADNYGVIGYAGYTGDPWYLNLSAGVNRQNYSSVRRADFTGFSGAANGKFNGQSITLQTEFGYPLTLPADVVLTPLASLTYGYQHVDGYKETGGNGMALDVGSLHSQSVVSDIGARIEKTFATGMGNLTPFAQVSWIHQYDDRQVSSRASYAADTIGETSFITKGAAPVEDMAGLAIGSTLYDANALSFDARYDLQAGDRYQAHTFSLRLRKTF